MAKMFVESVKLIFSVLVLGLFLVSFVSASNLLVGTSDSGVQYDKEILGQFLISDWVHVTIKVHDFSNIIIDYQEDSVEVQTEKDNQRWDVYRNTSESVLSTLSEEEFQLKSKSEFGRSFSGNITKEGFDKLLQDERVKHIYSDKEIYSSLSESAPLINADNVWADYDGTGQTVCVIDTGIDPNHVSLPEVFYVVRGVGNCNLMVEFQTATLDEFEKVKDLISTKFGKLIADEKTVQLTEEHKCAYFPK